jgi:hypothetical protein
LELKEFPPEATNLAVGQFSLGQITVPIVYILMDDGRVLFSSMQLDKIDNETKNAKVNMSHVGWQEMPPIPLVKKE